MTAITVRPIDIHSEPEYEALNDLRFRVLREPLGLPRGTERIAQDNDDATVILGAFSPEGQLLGTATLVENDGLQLRAMAVEPALQGKGVGAAILVEAARVAAERKAELWCDARVHAVGFYEKAGWVVEGDIFEVPTIGPHYIMRYRPQSA